MNINNFMNVAKNYALDAQSDAMIVKNAQGGTTSAGRLGNVFTRFFRNVFGVGKDQHAAIRRDLAQALATEYGGVHSIPKNVLEALKLDSKKDLPLDKDGNLMLGSTPLTARRIVAVTNAVNYNRRVAEMTEKLNAAFARAAQADEDFGRDYENPHKTLKYQLNDFVKSLARKCASTKPDAFSEPKARTFIKDTFAGFGYRVNGDSASFGLSGAAPKPAVMDALIDDLVDAVAPPAVKRNRKHAVNQLAKWCQKEQANLAKNILRLETEVAELKKQEQTEAVRKHLDDAEFDLGNARNGLKVLKEQCGETPEAQKAWATRFLANTPRLTKYLNTTLSPEKINEVCGSYVDSLKESLDQGLRVNKAKEPTGFSGNFLREISEDRIGFVKINGETPRPVRKNPNVDLGHEQVGTLESYKKSERIKAFVEQLAEVIPDTGVRQFVTSAIAENGFAMMLSTKMMDLTHHRVNDTYSSFENMQRDSIGIYGATFAETQIELNVDKTTGAIDIRLRGGVPVSYQGTNPFGTGSMAQTLFDIPFEAHITIPGGQHVVPGEMPQMTAELKYVEE